MGDSAITKGQIKKIHTLKTMLGIDEAAYRERLKASFGIETSKDLSLHQAAAFIDELVEQAGPANARKASSKRVSEPARNGFASPAQIAFIKSLWRQVSRAEPEHQKKALRRFVARQAKVSDLRFLRDKDASKIICALKAMQAQEAGDN